MAAAALAKKISTPRRKLLDPPSLRSLYRLVLRASTASVGHHPGATRSMRKLYRPVFGQAHDVMAETSSTLKPAGRRTWLKEFDIRMDATLSFLISSALTSGSTGIAHKYTETTAFLTSQLRPPSTSRNPVVWDAKNPRKAAARAAAASSTSSSGSPRRKQDIEDSVFGQYALKQTRMLAEGMGGVILGRNQSQLPSRR